MAAVTPTIFSYLEAKLKSASEKTAVALFSTPFFINSPSSTLKGPTPCQCSCCPSAIL